MHADTVLIILLTAIGAAGLPAVGWWYTWRRLDHLSRAVEPGLAAADRLDQIERSLEALASAQEQLADSQDLLTRVVSDLKPKELPAAGTGPAGAES